MKYGRNMPNGPLHEMVGTMPLCGKPVVGSLTVEVDGVHPAGWVCKGCKAIKAGRKKRDRKRGGAAPC